MRKGELLNQPLISVIAAMGHQDELVIADAGLPVPLVTQRIDLALAPGVPGFLETVRVVLSELVVESAVIAEELPAVSPKMHQDMLELLGEIPIEIVPHEGFKQKTAGAHAVVRTGEFTPYANVIFRAGVRF